MIVCLTGGIGSGKTTISNIFSSLGIPVYIADIEARKLMEFSKDIRDLIIKEFGEESYLNNKPNRKYLATIVFNDKEKLKTLNSIIHPRVESHFNNWYIKQKSHYVIKESAVLFESGGCEKCDKIVLVIASKENRIKRVIKRDKVSRKDVLDRIKNQWPDQEKKKYADYIIRNDVREKMNSEVERVHIELLKIGC